MGRFDPLRPRAGVAGLLQRLLVGVLGVAAFIAAMAFSLVALLTLLTAGSVFALRWWWKLRGLRQTMSASRAGPRGVVIEGEVLREEISPPRLPPGELP